MRVMDLPGWMPKLIRSFITRDGDAPSVEQTTIENILRVMDDHIVFTGNFKGRPFYFDFSIPDRKTSDKVAEVLRRNRGKTVGSISTIELPMDEGAG